MGALGWIVMPILWIALIALIVWAVTRLVRTGGGGGGNRIERREETPQDVLDRRFASGEIDASAYEQLKARLAERP
ncbi:MAG: SHOCT domain-containing protein [Mycobacterium leprae]